MKDLQASEAFILSEMLREKYGIALSEAIPIGAGDQVYCLHGLPLTWIMPNQGTVVKLTDVAYYTGTKREIAVVGRCRECGRIFYRPNFFH